jgi:hypothetical protein
VIRKINKARSTACKLLQISTRHAGHLQLRGAGLRLSFAKSTANTGSSRLRILGMCALFFLLLPRALLAAVYSSTDVVDKAGRAALAKSQRVERARD